MKRQESTIRLLVAILLVALVVLPLAGPVAGDELGVELLIADEDVGNAGPLGQMLPLIVGDSYSLATGKAAAPGLHSPTDEFPYGAEEFIPGLVPEDELGAVAGLNPLDSAEEIEALAGRSFCVVVYDGDVEYEGGLAGLDGERAGVTAFAVSGTVAPEGEGLPSITLEALDPSEVCGALDGGGGGKLALYWVSSAIWSAQNRDIAAQDVLDRGFTHVIDSQFLLEEGRPQWFSTKGFKVIQGISPTKWSSVPITPRYHSPYEEPALYAAKLANLEAYLMAQADYLVGILDDIELYPWPTRTYKANGMEESYPDKVPIARSPDDYDYRIGNADAGSTWRTFRDHPSDGTHDVPDLTIENIEYNFPRLDTSHEVISGSLNLGYFPPTSTLQVGRLAQTFRPSHDRITRIDILVARHGRGAPGFPPGHVYLYLTETSDDGKPNEKIRLFDVDLRVTGEEIGYDAGEDFSGIAPLSLYFDPEAHGALDTTKTYALVLEYRGGTVWSEDSVWYVLAADDSNAYSGGESFRFLGGENWAPFGSDIWFKVYYPDPPAGWGLRQFHEDWIDFQTDVMKWHVEEYRRILDRVDASQGTSLGMYVYSGYSGPLVDWKGRTVSNLHGGFTTKTFYSVDWEKLVSAGLDYAMAGYGQQDISMTLADLAGRAELIGGAQNQADFDDRWWRCNKKAVLWFHPSVGDPGVVVPRGRSPKSIQ